MNEDLALKIKQIANMLNEDALPDNLNDIISLFTGSVGSVNDPDSQKQYTQGNHSNNNNKSNNERIKANNAEELAENLEMLKTVKNIMDGLNSKSDPRVNLLNALKPFLNSNRQKKIGNCIKFLQVTSLLETMKELEENNN